MSGNETLTINSLELQNHLLDILKAFHLICQENNLNYYIIGGTCLGAARHQGFIPWDDDIDVGMPREDYEKFCNLDRSCFPDNLELRYYKNTDKSPFHFVKLVDNNTTLIEKSYLNYIEGLFLDVFPIDGVNYRNKVFELIRINRIWFEKVIIYYNSMTDTKDNFFKKILIFIAKKLPLSYLHNHVEKLMKKYSFKDSSVVANFFGAWKEKEIYPKVYLGTPTLYKFEDTHLYGPEQIDAYLTHVYGDYLTLPPEDKRVFRHNYYYINLNESFYDNDLLKS